MKSGGAATGQATFTGASATAGGALTYRVYSDSACTTALSATGNPSTVTVVNRLVPVSGAIGINQVGTVYWRASYAGDGANNAATSGCISQLVAKSTPALTFVWSPPGPITAGGSSSGTAALAGISNLAGGSMVYTVYSNNTCSSPVVPAQSSTNTVSGGIAPISAPFSFGLSGSYYGKAVYSGDAFSSGASSSCTSLTVSKTLPTVALTVAPTISPQFAGGTAIGSASLTGASTAAGGSLVYTAYSNSVCTSVYATTGNPSTVIVASGTAPSSSSLAFAVNSTYYWKAVYGGDANNATAASPCVPLVFNKAVVILDVAPASPAVKAGIGNQNAATLTGATTAATGTLVYTIYTDGACTTQFAIVNNPSTVAVANRVAPLSAGITYQSIGGLFVRAVYSGDANNLGASTPCVAFTVAKSDPTMSLPITPLISPMKAGGKATAKGTLALSTTAASGTVLYSAYTDSACTTLYVATSNPSTASVSNHFPGSSAQVTLDLATSFYWSGVYSGDANNNGATSACVALTVAKADPALALAISPDSTPMRAEGTASGKGTFSLSSNGAGGAIIYSLYSDSSCSSAYAAPGSPSTVTVESKIIPKSASIPFRDAGTYYWQATYAGDTNNNGATSPCVLFTVGKTDPFPWLAVYPTTYPMKVGGSLYGLLYLNGVTTSVTGSVTFTAYSEYTCTTSLSASGSPSTVLVASHINPQSAPITIPISGTVYLRATYTGDANNNSATSLCVASIVGKATPAVILSPTASVAPMTTGGSAFGTATLVGATTNAGGTLSYSAFTDSGCNTALPTANNPNTVTVTNRAVPNSPPITVSIVGTVYWNASYAGDANNAPAVSPCLGLAVAKTMPVLQLGINPSTSPMIAGSSATGSVTLTGANGTAGGSVTYTVYANNVCSVPTTPARASTKTIVSGIAPSSDAFMFATTGTVYWRALYTGDTTNSSASSTCTALSIVDIGATTVRLSLFPNPAIVEASVVATAVLSGTTATAGGSVTYAAFSDDSCSTPVSPSVTSTNSVTNGVVAASGGFSFAIAGSYYWHAVYSGDATNLSNTSPCSVLTVAKTVTSVTLTLSPNPVEAGHSVMGMATVPGMTSTAGGTVTYGMYTNNGCTAQVIPAPVSTVAVTNGTIPASAPITVSLFGTAYWMASYSGDANNGLSSSACVAVSAGKATTALVYSTLPVAPRAGESISLAVSVTGATTSAGGTTTYTIYSEQSCVTKIAPTQQSTKAVAGSIAASSDPVTLLAAGVYYWQAVYSGDANNNPTTGACAALPLSRATPTLTLAQVPNPINIGQGFTVHITLSADAVSPTGSISAGAFLDDDCLTPVPGLELYVANLVNGTIADPPETVFDFPTIIYGQASYSGDANNAPTTSLCSGAVVARGLPLSIAISPGTTILHGASTSAQAQWPPANVPIGTITYTPFAGADCSGDAIAAPETVAITGNVVDPSSTASFQDPGAFSWQANYSGDTIYNASSACAEVTVTGYIPSLALIISPVISPMTVAGGASAQATLVGASRTAGGTISYTVYADLACTTIATIADSQIDTSVIDGIVPRSDTITLAHAGDVYWQASYSGDTANAAVASPCVKFTVGKATPSLALTQLPNPVSVGEDFTGHMTLSSDAVHPTGTATLSSFLDRDCSIPSIAVAPFVATLVGGVIPDPPVVVFDFIGTVYGQASYSGDGDNAAATSPCEMAVVARELDLTLILGPSSTILNGQSASAQAFWPENETPIGTVTYTAFSSPDCTGAEMKTPEMFTIVSNAVSSSELTSFTAPGIYSWQAEFSGGGTFNPESICRALVVQATPILELAQLPDPVNIGDEFTVHLSLSSDGITPTGIVTAGAYLDSDCSIAVPGLEPYVASIIGGEIADPPSSIFEFAGIIYGQATYSGDANNASVVSPCVGAVIAEGLDLTVALSPSTTILHGESSSAQGTWPLSDTPTGTIGYRAFEGADCGGAPLASQETFTIANDQVSASTPIAFPNPGLFSWRTSYPGDHIYNPISICTPLIVQATPLLTLVQLPNPVKIGEDFTGHMTLTSDGITPTGFVTVSTFVDSGCAVPLPGVEPYAAALVDGVIPDPPATVFDFARVFYGQAAYSGDANNVAVATPCEAIVIEVNPLTVSVTGGTLEPVGYSQAASNNSGSLVITVTDERATGEGWTISVLANDFAFAGLSPTGVAIPAGNLSITSVNDPSSLWGEPIGSGGPFASPDALGTLDQSRTVAIAEVGYGTGSYAFTVGITLGIPAESQTGIYTAILEVLISAAP